MHIYIYHQTLNSSTCVDTKLQSLSPGHVFFFFSVFLGCRSWLSLLSSNGG